MCGEGDEKSADDDEYLLPPAGQLARDHKTSSDKRGVRRVTEEQPQPLGRVPMKSRGDTDDPFWLKEGVEVRHVRDRFHEVESKSYCCAVDDSVDDVVEVVAHDQEKEDDRDALRDLFQRSRHECQ